MTPASRRRAALVVAWNLGATAALLLAVEGGARVILASRGEPPDAPPSAARAFRERQHTAYDPEIGWINRPNVRLPDLYGPGRGFTTDDRGFRDARPGRERENEPSVRIVCSGDSFTMGYGVDDADTWCHLLERRLPHTETFNLGVGGYGVDQAYLWYRRNADALEHDVHLFAFISADFVRMGSDRFLGYGKPLFRLDGDALVLTNVPVAGPTFGATTSLSLRRALSTLAIVRLLGGEARGAPDRRGADAVAAEPARVAARVLDALAAATAARGATLVLVHLPIRDDYDADEGPQAWRAIAAREARRLGVPFVDVTEAMRRLPPDRVDGLFRGHYSEAGNAFVAREIATALRAKLRRRG